MPVKRYDLAVYIGRFQPPHSGHQFVMESAAKSADRVLMLIGSSNSSRSVRNPFSFAERVEMLSLMAGGMDAPFEFRGIYDSAYNFNDWLIRVKSEVESAARDIGVAHPRIALAGAFKDDTSFYLKYFPEWELAAVPVYRGLSSSRVRDALYQESCGAAGQAQPSVPTGSDPEAERAFLEANVAPPVLRYLRAWQRSDAFSRFREEREFVDAYKARWAGLPYPALFVTTDAVVVCLGRVLVIRRGRHPGLGLYALPGGFLDEGETLEDGCLRELREETGLSGQYLRGHIRDRHVFDQPDRDPRGRIITHAFLIDLSDADSLPEAAAGDDAASLEWMPLQDLERNEELFSGDHARIIQFFLNRMN